MAALIFVICILRIIVELFQLLIYSGEYLTSWVNFMEGFLYFGTIIFVLSDYEFYYLANWRWQLGALCIFLSWINFVLFLSKEPTFGIYVIMLEVMIKTFLKTIPMTALLILAFGQPFYMLLSPVIITNEDGEVSIVRDSFSLVQMPKQLCICLEYRSRGAYVVCDHMCVMCDYVMRRKWFFFQLKITCLIDQ